MFCDILYVGRNLLVRADELVRGQRYLTAVVDVFRIDCDWLDLRCQTIRRKCEEDDWLLSFPVLRLLLPLHHTRSSCGK